MKKRLLTLMAIVMALGMVFIAGPVLAGTSGNIGGGIPDVRVIDSVNVDDAMIGAYFTGIDVDDYALGYTLSADGATTVTVTANTPWEVTVTAGVTGNYFNASPVGLGDTPRTVDQKPLSELLLKVTGINEGDDENSAAPTIDGGWADYTTLDFAGKDLVTCASGNDSAFWNIGYKMMLDTSSLSLLRST
jgi:hypothetical protein